VGYWCGAVHEEHRPEGTEANRCEPRLFEVVALEQLRSESVSGRLDLLHDCGQGAEQVRHEFGFRKEATVKVDWHGAVHEEHRPGGDEANHCEPRLFEAVALEELPRGLG
jgi:hypothetical protein